MITTRFLLRGTTTLACAALLSSSFLAPAAAAASLATFSSVSSTTALQQLALQPSTPKIPTAEEIEKAKQSGAATATAAAELEAIIEAASQRLAITTVASMGANSAFTDALTLLEAQGC